MAVDYRSRVADTELTERLAAIGAVLIDGPKGCGKTETATRVAHSTVRFDTDANARALVGLNPESLFDLPTPILFDEWQRAPQMWDHVRRHVDDLGQRGSVRADRLRDADREPRVALRRRQNRQPQAVGRRRMGGANWSAGEPGRRGREAGRAVQGWAGVEVGWPDAATS